MAYFGQKWICYIHWWCCSSLEQLEGHQTCSVYLATIWIQDYRDLETQQWDPRSAFQVLRPQVFYHTRQISCMIRTGVRTYQGKAWGSAFLPPLISPWSGSKLEINIDLAFMIFFSSIFSFHDLCDIFIISPNVRSPALPHIVLVPFLACIYETLIGHTSVVCKFWICNVYICIKW